MGASFPNIGSSSIDDPIGKAVVEIIADDKAYQKGLSKSRKDLQTFDREAERITKNVSRNFAIAGGAIAAGLGVAVAKFTEFERSMKNVQAVAGATGEEYVKLKDFALEMGSETVFSAREAGEAMYFLASAGQEVGEQMQTTASVLDLAAATQSGLAESAEVIVNSLSAFQLQADQSRRVADVFAESISSSQANLVKLRMALPQTATVFNDLNQSIEANVAALSLLFDRGVRAETAATGLRNNLLTLLDPTAEARIAMGDLGLSVEELNPTMNSLVDIVQKLETAGFDTADSVRIFGKESNALAVLASTGADKLRDFEQSLIGASGAAQTMKDVQLDSLAGDLQLLKSAAEGAAIAFGEGLSPAIRTAAEETTTLISAFNALPGPIKSALSIATASAAGLLGTLGLIGLIVPKIRGGFGELKIFTKLLGTDVSILTERLAGLNIAGASVLAWILGIPAGIATFAAGLKLGTNAIDDMKDKVFNLNAEQERQASNVAKIQRGIDGWKKELEFLNGGLKDGVTNIQRMDEASGQWIDTPIAERIEFVEGKIANLNKELRLAGGDFRDTIPAVEGMTNETSNLSAAIEALFDPMKALGDALGGVAENADLSLLSFIKLRGATDFLFGEMIASEQKRNVEELGRSVGAVKDAINSVIDVQANAGKRFASLQTVTLGGMLGNILKEKTEVEDEITTFRSIDFSELLTDWDVAAKTLQNFGTITSATFGASTEEWIAQVDKMLGAAVRQTTAYTGLMNTRSKLTKKFVSEQLAEIKASTASAEAQIAWIDSLEASLNKRNITEEAFREILEATTAARTEIFTKGIIQLKESSKAEADNADSIIRDQLRVTEAMGVSYNERIGLIDNLKKGLIEESELYQELSDAQVKLFDEFIKGEKRQGEAEGRAFERGQLKLAKSISPINIQAALAMLDELQDGYAEDSEEFLKYQNLKSEYSASYFKQVLDRDGKGRDERLGILDSLTEAQRRYYNNLKNQNIDYSALTKSELEIVEQVWEEAGDTIAGGMRAAIAEAASATTDWKDVFTDAVGDAKSATDDLFISIFSQEDEKRARELNREIRKYNRAIEELTSMQEEGIEKISLYEVGIEDFGRAVGPVEEQILKLQDAIGGLNDEADDRPNRWEQYFSDLKNAAIRNLAELTTDTAWKTFANFLDRLDKPKQPAAAVGDAGDFEITGFEQAFDIAQPVEIKPPVPSEPVPETVEVRTREEEDDTAGATGKAVAIATTAKTIYEIAQSEFNRENVAQVAARLGLPEETIEAKLEDVFTSYGFKKKGEAGGADFETALGTGGITQPGNVFGDLFTGEGLAGVRHEVWRLQREAAQKQLEEEGEEPHLAPRRFVPPSIDAMMEDERRRRRIFLPDRPIEMARPQRMPRQQDSRARSDTYVRIDRLELNMPPTIRDMPRAELDRQTTRQIDSVARAFERNPAARRRIMR
jgi:TP901 family phage tail tape measure protein